MESSLTMLLIFDILGIKSLVDSTLQGVAGVCPVQNEAIPSSNEVTQDNSSTVKIDRLKIYERFKSIQKVFTEDYLKMVAQAAYNHEYCLDSQEMLKNRYVNKPAQFWIHIRVMF